MRTAIFRANYDQLDAIRKFAGQAAKDAGMDEAEVYTVELCMDEACTNVIEHAYEGKQAGQIECTFDITSKDLVIVIHDHGKTFDPTTVGLPDLDADLNERQVGGLGIFLMKKLMDEVRFEPLGEAGNVLTMVKHLPDLKETQKKKLIPAWKKLILLGEELINTNSLVMQRDLILSRCNEIFHSRVEVWLNERIFKLPDINLASIFPAQPAHPVMSGVVSTGEEFVGKEGLLVAVPLRSKDLVMGVLLVERDGKAFQSKEINLLHSLAGHVSLALIAAHRFAVDQWRVEQLTLVRKVSAQVANVLDLDELTRRITRLIQRTFHYYYVSIFTIEPDAEELHFRASAGPEKGGGKKVKVRVGEGLIGTVAQSGEEAVTNDVNRDAVFKYIALLPNTQSEAVLPIKIEERILGVLDVQSDSLDAFHPNDLLVLRALADSIATAINGARLYSELRMRIDQMAMVVEVGEKITTTLDLEELLTKVAGLIQNNLHYPYVHLYSVHLNRRKVIYEAGSGARNYLLKGYSLDLDNDRGIIPWVASNAQTLMVNDVAKDERYQPSPFPPHDTLSEMAIPLIFNDQVLGVLDLQSNRKNAFSDDHRYLCEALANNIAAAMRNANLFRTERWRRQVADSLHAVAGLISTDSSLEDVLEMVLLELERNLTAEASAIWLMEVDELLPAQAHGVDLVELENVSKRWPEASQYLLTAMVQDQPVIRKPDDPIGPAGMALGFSADYSSIIASLRAADRPLGVLVLSHHLSGRYGNEAQAITATFANYAAAAIENTRLFDAAQEQAYASAALLQVAQTVASSNDLEETIGSIVRITPILVGVQACGIYLANGDLLQPTQSYGFPDPAQESIWRDPFSKGEFPLLDKVMEDRQMVAGLLPVNSTEDWLNPNLALNEEETLYALETAEHLLLGFPLMIKNDIFGVLLIEEGCEAQRFRQKRVDIITSIAQQVALSIQNEQLQHEMVNRERLEYEIHLARQIQLNFLPDKLPDINGWNLAATWITARQVGGDFYDIFELPDEKMGLFIADVSDKGIPAALFMALTRTLVRAIVFDTPSPAEALQKVNALIIPDNRQEMFVTGVYGVLDLKTGRFVYANAGHNPPIILSGLDRSLKLLHRTGAAMGIIQDISIEERSILIDKEDFLLLYTDGITEATSPNDQLFGEEGLRHSLLSTRARTSKGILDHIESSVKSFMNSLQPSDDLTMLGIRRISDQEG